MTVQSPEATPPAPAPATFTVTEPPAPAGASGSGPEGRFTAADLEKARGEEKDKLYGRITKADERLAAMETELAQLRQERDARLQQETESAQAVAEAEKTKRESEMSAKKLVEERTREWNERFAALQQERETERETLLKEAEFAQLRAYVQERVGAERENIAPELIDLVAGNSPEEIDASVELLKAKTAQIFEGLREAQQQQRAPLSRGVSPTGLSANGPGQGDGGGTRQLTAKQIKELSMADYQKYREQLLGSAALRDPYKHGLLG